MKVYASSPKDAAVDYRRRGMSVIPLKGKISAEPWAEFQNRRMTPEEIKGREWRDVGIVTGRISGLVVLDADSPEAQEELKRRGHAVTPMARTARGVHAYFKHPGGELPTQIGLGEGLDLKGDGGYVVAPPSRHPSGAVYEWIISFDEAEPADLPGWAMDKVRLRSSRRTSAEDLGEEIPNGSRNEALTSIAGTLRRRGLGESAIYAALLGINEKTCRPPLGEGEVFKIAQSMGRYEPEGASFYSSEHKDVVPDECFLKVQTAREVAAATPPEVEWIARPYVARGCITEVDGKIKAAGKTTWISHMMACVESGRAFMGEPTTKTKVMILTEQTPTSFRKVLERAGLTESEDIYVVHWHDVAGFEWPEVGRLVTDKALELGAGLLVVDTLGQFAGIKGDGENNAGAAHEAMKPLQEAAAKGLAVAMTRHERKGGGEVGESGRGSSAFGGAVDVILSIRRGEGNTRPSVRIIESLSRFDETPDKLVVELTDGGYRSLGDASAFAEKEAMAAIVDLLPAKAEHAMTTNDIVDGLAQQNIKRTAATHGLAQLTTAGTITRIGEGKRGNPYRYYKPTTQDPPGDLESPDPVVEKHSSATTTYIRTNKKELSEDQQREVYKLVKQGFSEEAARSEVLAKDHPLDCECEVCL